MLDDIKAKWKSSAPSEDIRREELARLFGKYMDEQRVAVQETAQERNQGGVRYSFGGERARSADKTSLATELIKESEEEKINRLKKARVEYVTASNDSISKMSEIDVTNASSRQIEKLVFPLLSNFETFGTHYNKVYDVEFDYSRKSASRSISHQIRITGKDFSANAIVHANLKELCKTAYPVEVHEDEKPNNKAFES